MNKPRLQDAAWIIGTVMTLLGATYVGANAVILVAGAAAFGILVSITSRSSFTAAVFWVTAVLIIPPWIYLQFAGLRLAPAAVIALAIIVGRFRKTSLQINVVDRLMIAMAVAAVISAALASTPLHILSQIVLEWGLCYAAARLISADDAFGDYLARLGAVTGALAIAQAVTRVDVSDLPVFSFSVGATNWMGLQSRAGIARAELTTGQSIALGGILAMFLAFALTSRSVRFKILFVVLISGGLFATVSRGALLSALLVVFLCVLTLRITKASRFTLLGVTALAGLATATFFGDFLEQNATAELSDGTGYRQGLLSTFQYVRPFGLAENAVPSGVGTTFTWDGYFSIDNGILYIALYAGAAVAACVIGSLIVLLWWSTRRGLNGYAIAVLGQIPLLLTVAPITQYQDFLFLFLGLASSTLGSRAAPPPLAESRETGFRASRERDLGRAIARLR